MVVQEGKASRLILEPKVSEHMGRDEQERAGWLNTPVHLQPGVGKPQPAVKASLQLAS